MRFLDLTEYDILRITSYLDKQSVVNLKNTCKELMTMIENDLKLLKRAIWRHYKTRCLQVRRHIRITAMSKLVKWVFDISSKANKAEVVKRQIDVEVTCVKEVLQLDDHKKVILLPPAIKYIKMRLHYELIEVHMKLKVACTKMNGHHWKGSATPICSMEDVVYQYINDSNTPPILITYLLTLINRSNLISAVEPDTPTEKGNEDCYNAWLNEFLYLIPDPGSADPYEGRWPPKLPQKCERILQNLAPDT